MNFSISQTLQLFNSGDEQVRKSINETLWQVVPFNQPHRITVTRWTTENVTAQIPHVASNLNHLQGIHACGLATVAEYVTGLLLLTNLGIENYRLIMARLDINYTFQARKDCFASFELTPYTLQNEIVKPLQTLDKIIFPATVQVTDADGNEVCLATIHWQIKSWDKVHLK